VKIIKKGCYLDRILAIYFIKQNHFSS